MPVSSLLFLSLPVELPGVSLFMPRQGDVSPVAWGYTTRNVINVLVQMSSPTPQFLSNIEIFIPRGWVS